MVRLLLILMLIMPLTASADVKKTVETITSTDSLENIVLPQTTTAYTKSFSLANHEATNPLSVAFKATTVSGSPNFTIEAQQSFQRPTTEAVADSSYVGWKHLVTSSTSTNWQVATIDSVTMPYGRFKITGGSGNSATTTIQIKVIKQ